jgi:5-formyltetrahydrofolate cyclo-ligase
MTSQSEKDLLRVRYRHERHERYVDHSFSYVAKLPEFARAKVIASYVSYGDEPSTSELNAHILDSGKILLLPRILGRELEWVPWNGDTSELVSRKKILEPAGDAYKNSSEIEVIVVPALRIDRSGYRLGQGGGFYDRALVHLKAWKIGLIHPDEISGEDLPREEHDIPLDALATPDLILRFNSK